VPDLPEAPKVPTTARHYAEAIFELAKEEGSFTPWGERLARLRHLLEDSELGHAVASPQFSSSQRAELAKAVVSQEKEIDRAGENLVLLLIQTRRTAMLAAIEAGYAELVDRAEGRVKAVLSTAVAVSPEELARFGKELSERLGLEVNFRSEVDPDLLGGAVVRVGDRVFDASLKTRLQQLRREMLTEAQPS
jgi:F-type H+-transporting ATPase subunit delta